MSGVRSMARWRPASGVQPPKWVRCYAPAKWPSMHAWMDACSLWFAANPAADEAFGVAWAMTVPDEPFDPYESA